MGIYVFHNILLLGITLLSVIHKATAGCTFPQHTAENEKIEALIQPLLGNRYKAEDVDNKYLYKIGICADAVDKTEVPGASNEHVGVYQFKLKDGAPIYEGAISVGKYNNATITRGTGWILLEYRDGKEYHTHCSKEKRQARIMIICDESTSLGSETINVFEEYTNKTDGCYYLFEMASSAVCPPKPVVTFGLSLGSVIVIVFVCVVFLYLVLGIAYHRFMLGAKGMEQIPNYSFWQDFGNLQSDGCNLVCRTGGSVNKHTFKGLGDDQLQEEEDRDDHLLPM
ncbi:cation-dependent mannose-6-phosphate receptor-like [Mizuhopecten yessoensis]|uniref:Cation-dependent mannose-6-phosphate receptor n=1 Tax=Mizuhopecten yessoensis TaxID=6573 RepID=A0A210PG74_MIZYE|nr:cation-dependent mannose-6-phosphate receptor-like [Mizuhopecten yessoensis]OWF35446.1 Cation-dependent mannose-6-phosphate receptor [Mizuhopecten yessoensis]